MCIVHSSDHRQSLTQPAWFSLDRLLSQLYEPSKQWKPFKGNWVYCKVPTVGEKVLSQKQRHTQNLDLLTFYVKIYPPNSTPYSKKTMFTKCLIVDAINNDVFLFTSIGWQCDILISSSSYRAHTSAYLYQFGRKSWRYILWGFTLLEPIHLGALWLSIEVCQIKKNGCMNCCFANISANVSVNIFTKQITKLWSWMVTSKYEIILHVLLYG